MRAIRLGIINASNEETEPHENNVSPFFPHSDGFCIINCKSLEASTVGIQISDDGITWVSHGGAEALPIDATDRTYTLLYSQLGRYVRIAAGGYISGSANCFLIGS